MESKDRLSEMNKTNGFGNNNSFNRAEAKENSMIGSKEDFFTTGSQDFKVNPSMMMTGMSKHAESDMM